MTSQPLSFSIRALAASDFAEADRICGLAFARFLGEDPVTFMAGRETVRMRCEAKLSAGIGLWSDDRLIGSNILTNWGAFSWFGPLTIDPAYWGRGGARLLLEQTMAQFEAWRTRAMGLYTFSGSSKHHHLYEQFDFWPRFLTVILRMPVGSNPKSGTIAKFSELQARKRDGCLAGVRDLGDALFPGLDVRSEVRAAYEFGVGDTLCMWSDSALQALAVCHYGVGSEAEPGICYVKFAAVRPGGEAQANFIELLNGCEALAAEQGLTTVEAGVNVERTRAYRSMLARGFRASVTGVQMFYRNDPAYNTPDAFIIDDLR